MKTTLNKILNKLFVIGLILTICLIVFNQFICNPQQPEIIIKKDTIRITEYKENLKVDTIIQNKYITKNVHDTIKVIVKDTVYIASEIISDWFAVKFIPDTIFNTDSLLLVISDSLERNTIKHRKIDYNAITTTNIYPVDSKMHFYIGVNSYISDEIELSLNAYLQKNRHLLCVGVNNKGEIVAGYAFRLN
jgi:hypothetical protein